MEKESYWGNLSAMTDKEAREEFSQEGGGGGGGIRDRKAREEFDKKLLAEYEESESDEDVKLCDASFKRAVNRGRAKAMKIIEADMKLELEFHVNEIREEERKHHPLMIELALKPNT
ncbi:hypothetical protein MTR_1g012190 [Medicago truncatula]|uniref:Uncharacterized protein n=2 Tax=Medicago truncatula TaxID=3880 RepID=G7I6X7_MEDTR|nr:hypothetical protein MTR_1g012180 [Medicago truncatula]AES58988.2 hypothetical protein MTR_1g012190 [Medicago truncatula]